MTEDERRRRDCSWSSEEGGVAGLVSLACRSGSRSSVG